MNYNDDFSNMVHGTVGNIKGKYEPEDELWSDMQHEEIPEVHLIIPQLAIELGSYNIISAMGGTGKSWIAYELLLSLSRGEKLFGAWAIDKPYNVMLLDYEMHRRQYLIRLKRLQNGREIATNLGDVIYNDVKKEYYLSDNTIESLSRKIDKHSLDVIIVDSLSKMVAGDINTDKDIRITNLLRTLAAEKNVAIIMLHHFAKTTKVRKIDDMFQEQNTTAKGSQQITDTAENTWVVYPNPKDYNELWLTQSKKNHFPVPGVHRILLEDFGNINPRSKKSEGIRLKYLDTKLTKGGEAGDIKTASVPNSVAVNNTAIAALRAEKANLEMFINVVPSQASLWKGIDGMHANKVSIICKSLLNRKHIQLEVDGKKNAMQITTDGLARIAEIEASIKKLELENESVLTYATGGDVL